MPTVIFASAFQRHVPVPAESVDGSTVAEALESVFARHPAVRGYVLDDQGAVRKHVAVLVGGAPLRDRATLGDAVTPATEIHVLQALSGG